MLEPNFPFNAFSPKLVGFYRSYLRHIKAHSVKLINDLVNVDEKLRFPILHVFFTFMMSRHRDIFFVDILRHFTSTATLILKLFKNNPLQDNCP